MEWYKTNKTLPPLGTFVYVKPSDPHRSERTAYLYVNKNGDLRWFCGWKKRVKLPTFKEWAFNPLNLY